MKLENIENSVHAIRSDILMYLDKMGVGYPNIIKAVDDLLTQIEELEFFIEDKYPF